MARPYLNCLLLFLLLILFLPLFAAVEFDVQLSSDHVFSGDAIDISVVPSDDFYRAIYVYDVNDTYMSHLVMPCSSDHCGGELESFFNVPIDWDGQYYFSVYDYSTNNWVKKDFLVIGCTHECYVRNQIECMDNGSYRVCGDYDQDNCNEWGVIVECFADSYCSNGGCVSDDMGNMLDEDFSDAFSSTTANNSIDFFSMQVIKGHSTVSLSLFEDDFRGLTNSGLKGQLSNLQSDGQISYLTFDEDIATFKVNQEEDEYIDLLLLNNQIRMGSRSLDGEYIIEFEREPLIDLKMDIEENIRRSRDLSEGYSLAAVDSWFLASYYDSLMSYVHDVRADYLETNLQDKLVKHKGRIQSDHDYILRRLSLIDEITDNTIFSNIGDLGYGEYFYVFNGIAINLTGVSKEKLMRLRNIKKVHEDTQVQAFLYDSVDMVGATDFWGIDSNGANCSITGNECMTGNGVSIAVIDTGVDYTHTDLGGCFGQGCKVAGGYDFINEDNDPMDDHGHGTHVAATAAGQGVLMGVAPDATIYAYKVLSSSGSGSFSQVISGVEMAVDPNQDGNFSDHVDVISMSLGGWGDPDDSLSQAVDRAVDLGVVAVIAAGNSGPGYSTIGSPGTARNAITVGAVEKNGSVASFSSRGPVVWTTESGDTKTMLKPDVVAPGVDICAAQYDLAWNEKLCLDDSHVAISGTSMATPHVAGVAALLLQSNPDFTPARIKSAIKLSAKKLYDSNNVSYDIYSQGSGLVDVLSANQVSISVFPDVLDFGAITDDLVLSKDLQILNHGGDVLSLDISILPAVDFDTGLNYSDLVTAPSDLQVFSGENSTITFELDIPVGLEGDFIGKLLLSDGLVNYSIPYTFSRLSELLLRFDGRYPNFLVHDNDMTFFKYVWQRSGFEGDSYLFRLRSGNYTVYAVNDFVLPSNDYKETIEYMLSDVVSLPRGVSLVKDFSLDDGRKFTMKARDIRGDELVLGQWAKGFIAYDMEKRQVFSASFTDPTYGDKEIYLSNKPDNGLDLDILLNFIGYPGDE
jgi:hypothetical protein